MKRKKGVSIRRAVEHKDVPLPHDWDGFLSNTGNKSDLSDFLSHQFIDNAPDDVIAVTAGSLLDEEEVLCNKDINVEALQARHEEADTQIILHACHTTSNTGFVWVRDVLLLLIAHSHIIDKVVNLKAGTSKAQQFIPVNDIVSNLDIPPDLALTLLSFHAITGSNTTSYLAGHSK